MARGAVLPSEAEESTDPQTGVRVRRVTVYAPQHTHPHPSFSPDGSRVVFTSDRTGLAQVYEADVPREWVD
jgi:Tol biopolymer transport system component